MIVMTKAKSVKEIFEDFFKSNDRLSIGNMYFKPYNAITDRVVEKYVPEDWQKIFKDVTEEDLMDLSSCSNVVILIWYDKHLNLPHGMLYFEENHACPKDVAFHGGTWDHSSCYFRNIFKSVIHVFDYLLSYNINITTTCGLGNLRADKFQRQLCFETIGTMDSFIMKRLNKESYFESNFIKALRQTN